MAFTRRLARYPEPPGSFGPLLPFQTNDTLDMTFDLHRNNAL